MGIKQELKENIKNMEALSIFSCKLGAALMICFYITALTAGLIAPYGDYQVAMFIRQGCLEAAPTCLAAGICAGLIGDMIMANKKEKDSR